MYPIDNCCAIPIPELELEWELQGFSGPMDLESELNQRLKSHDGIGIGTELKAKSQDGIGLSLYFHGWNWT